MKSEKVDCKIGSEVLEFILFIKPNMVCNGVMKWTLNINLFSLAIFLVGTVVHWMFKKLFKLVYKIFLEKST